MQGAAEPRFWCANFDWGRNACARVDYGKQHNLWLMQYQYGIQEKGPTTRNLNIAAKVRPGDFLIARLTRPSRLFAIGRVCPPRAQADHWDTVERTVNQKTHVFTDGVVRYSDAPAVYDDFRIRQQNLEKDPGTGFFVQRIDVESWKYLRESGDIPIGFSKNILGVPYTALIDITRDYFEKIRLDLEGSA